MLHEIKFTPASLERSPLAQRVVLLLNRIEYRSRPSMHWDVRNVRYEGGGWCDYAVFFCPVFSVKDAENPTRTIDVFCPLIQAQDTTTEEELLTRIHFTIIEFERHEADEHYFVDDIKTHDPHRTKL